MKDPSPMTTPRSIQDMKMRKCRAEKALHPQTEEMIVSSGFLGVNTIGANMSRYVCSLGTFLRSIMNPGYARAVHMENT
jgi:hypothetical protein